MKRKRMSQSERRDQIARMAAQLFSEKGFAGTAVREIAHRARVSEPMIFKLFRSKDGLYRYLIENQKVGAMRQKFYSELAELTQANDDEGVFTTIAETILSVHLKDPTITRLSLFCALERRRTAKPMFEKHAGAFLDYLAGYIERRRASGGFADVDPKIAARAFIGMLGYFLMLRHIFGERSSHRLSTRRVAQTFAKIFLHGLKKR